MSEAQAEWAIQSLYENPGSRDELTDSEAEILLGWAEDQIMRLAEMDLTDDIFEAAFDSLSELTRRINRLAARRTYLTQEEQEVALNRIAEDAAAIGLVIPPALLTEFLSQPTNQSLDIDGSVRALIALVMSGTDGEEQHDEENQQ